MKADAVPGIPTTMFFTPKYTTEEMKKITGNPAFEYELACQEMCGNGHYSMKGAVKVVTPEEFILWRAKQKPRYLQVFPEQDPSNKKPAADTTSAATATPPVAAK
jgi:cytochrome c oxidase subunit 2